LGLFSEGGWLRAGAREPDIRYRALFNYYLDSMCRKQHIHLMILYLLDENLQTLISKGLF
jgi:hypothetical protein